MTQQSEPRTRFLSLLLCLAIVFGSLPFAVATVSAQINTNIVTTDPVTASATEIATYGDLKAFLENEGEFNGVENAKLCATVTATDKDVTTQTLDGASSEYTASAHVTTTNIKTIDLNGYDIDFNDKNSIYIPYCANLTVTNTNAVTQSNIKNGTGVKMGEAEGTLGGAFFNCGTLNVHNVSIKACTAKNGGGIYNQGDNPATLNKVTITDCTTTGEGGGIFNRDKAILNKVTIASCSATGKDSSGGGINNYGSGTATLTDVTVKECTATDCAGVNNSGQMTLAGNTQITGNKIGNTTNSNLTVYDILDDEPMRTPVTLAPGFCGTAGVLVVVGYCDGSPLYGSGVFATGTNIATLTSQFSADDSLNYDVAAKGDNNLALSRKIVTYSDLKAFLEDRGEFEGIKNAKLSSAVTASSTDVTLVTNTDGKMYTASAHVATTTDKTVDLNGCDIDFNNKNSIHISNGANLTVTNTNVATQSNIKNGIGVKPEEYDDGEVLGGAFYNSGTLSIYDVSIKACKTTASGGGICNDDGTTTLNRVTIASCKAYNGGGISNNEGSTATLDKVTIAGCTATEDEGGIYNAGIAMFTDVTVTACTAEDHAGIYNSQEMTLAGNTQITGNKIGDTTDSNLTVAFGKPVTLTDFTGSAGITVLNNEFMPGSGIFATVTDISQLEALKAKFKADEPDKYHIEATGSNLVLADGATKPTTDPTIYTITATSTDGGTITPGGTVKVTEGENQSFTATATDGYILEKFVVDGKDEIINGNVYTFEKVNATHTIQAVFTKKDEPQPTPTPINTGWKKTADGKWQYFDNSGKAVTGWQNSIKCWEGQWFYFDGSGIMQIGWHNDIPGWSEDQWFYFDRQTGVMQKGWAFVDDGHGDFSNKLWYYLDLNTGVMHTDWQKIDGKWYYLDYNLNNWGGAMLTGWQWMPYNGGKAWFCFAGNGAMYENTVTPDGYAVNEKGVWVQ